MKQGEIGIGLRRKPEAHDRGLGVPLSDLVLLVVVSAFGLVLAPLLMIFIVEVAPPCAEGQGRFGLVDVLPGIAMPLLEAMLWMSALCAVYAGTLLITGYVLRASWFSLVFRATAAALLSALSLVFWLSTPVSTPPPVVEIGVRSTSHRALLDDPPSELLEHAQSRNLDYDPSRPVYVDIETAVFYGSSDRQPFDTRACYDPRRRTVILERPRVDVRAVGQGSTEYARFLSAPDKITPAPLSLKRGDWYERLRARQTYVALTPGEAAALEAELATRSSYLDARP